MCSLWSISLTEASGSLPPFVTDRASSTCSSFWWSWRRIQELKKSTENTTTSVSFLCTIWFGYKNIFLSIFSHIFHDNIAAGGSSILMVQIIVLIFSFKHRHKHLTRFGSQTKLLAAATHKWRLSLSLWKPSRVTKISALRLLDTYISHQLHPFFTCV